MNDKIRALMNNQGQNHILPFFWQHGETEEVLREYMGVISGCGIQAVCLESRPHPDFCGKQWWHDVEVILKEAKARGMKVWLLDDRHFPTGYANGILQDGSNELSRQSLAYRRIPITVAADRESVRVPMEGYRCAPPWIPSEIEAGQQQPVFDEDEIISITAIPEKGTDPGDIINLTGQKEEGTLGATLPRAGNWILWFVYRTRNHGVHREFINMMDSRSCRKLIDAVYEPHYAHFGAEFGKTIAGFFSDEPELGNDHLYQMEKHMYQMDDQPFSFELQTVLKAKWQDCYEKYLPLLWEEQFESALKARVRYEYMDAVTGLVRKDFSDQLSQWCHDHGVEYIGHLIECVNSTATSGSSLGHYFRGLHGQDMSGIDVIGGQVYPQGENDVTVTPLTINYGEVFHYTLGRLGSSAAAIEPWKKGRAMCEIFGNYGWSEGVRLEKYLVDHFLARGINYFVPHAFSPKEFPDPDCPPHFYAGGHDPLYRHFGELMRYTNRLCHLLSGGHHESPVAVLYLAEGEWMASGEYTPMPIQAPARRLAEAQIEFDFVPADAVLETEAYHTEIRNTLRINTQEYRAVIVPETKYLSPEWAAVLQKLEAGSVPTVFINRLPEGICTGEKLNLNVPPERIVPLEKLAGTLKEQGICDTAIEPADSHIRCYHYVDGGDFFFLFNEGPEVYRGKVSVSAAGQAYEYNAWDNRIERVRSAEENGRTVLFVSLEPYKAQLVFFDAPGLPAAEPLCRKGTAKNWNDGWTRSICRSLEYPGFREQRKISLPDRLEQEKPDFSGFIRYEKEWETADPPESAVLEITDAHEGIEVFVNGKSIGIQIVPTYLFDIAPYIRSGKNRIRIEAATTLEREMSSACAAGGKPTEDAGCCSGINGDVLLWLQERKTTEAVNAER